MLRRLVTVAALLGAILALPAGAQAQDLDRPRAFVLWLDGTTLEDWAAAGPGPFATALNGGVATVVTPPPARDPVRAALAAAETVGAGRILDGAPTADDRPTPLWIALAAFRLEPVLFSGARDVTPAPVARALGSLDDATVERFAIWPDSQFPGGVRTETPAMADAVRGSDADVVIAQIPDVLLAEQALGLNAAARASWVSQTVARAEAVLGAMLEQADDTDLVMVLSPTPAGPRRADGTALGAIAIVGEGVPSGALISPSTSSAGVVSLTDVAPTLLAWFGFSRDDVDRGALPRFTDAPPGFAGSAIGGSNGPGFARARALEADLIDAARTHDAAARSFAIGGIVLALLAAGTVLSGRGAPSRAGRFPRGWRDGLATASIALVLYAPALLVARPIPAAVLAVAAAVGARALLGRDAALLSALLTCAALPLADIASGGGLIAKSALPTPIASGVRARPFDPIVLGLILAALPAAGLLLDRHMRSGTRRDERAPLVPLAFGVVMVFVAGTHGGGGDVGAVFALTPAVLLVALVASGARVSRHAIAGMVAATIAAAGLVTLTFGPALWVEEDPLIPMRAIPNLVGLRLDAFAEQLGTIWLVALIAVAIPAAILLRRRSALLARGSWGRPYLRAGMVATVVAAAIAAITVRGGPATAGVAAVLLAATVAVPMLTPER